MTHIDPTIETRQLFHIPIEDGKEKIYLCGNSLGLMLKSVSENIAIELQKWANKGVEGHFSEEKPWVDYHQNATKNLCKIVGARENEVICMNSLTVNLHLMLISFYQPTALRFKIVIESNTFPSDIYAIASQIRLRGFDPNEALVYINSASNSFYLSDQDFSDTILTHGESIALILISGVNYLSGQYFNIPRIAALSKYVGAKLGLDLAHAVGNVPLSLHEWEIDFAVWCSYKYLNGGPGCVGGAYIYEKHFENASILRLEGWWGNKSSTRFDMKNYFEPSAGIDAWQLSNAPILNMVALNCSLELIGTIGIENLRKKSLFLTNSLYNELQKIKDIETITPEKESERGCQVSIIVHKKGQELFDFLRSNNVVVDWRKPNIIRISPVPLYNTIHDVEYCIKIIKRFFKK